jgi:hypothetical protein
MTFSCCLTIGGDHEVEIFSKNLGEKLWGLKIRTNLLFSICPRNPFCKLADPPVQECGRFLGTVFV